MYGLKNSSKPFFDRDINIFCAYQRRIHEKDIKYWFCSIICSILRPLKINKLRGLNKSVKGGNFSEKINVMPVYSEPKSIYGFDELKMSPFTST